MGVTQCHFGPVYGTVSWSDAEIASFVDVFMEIARYIRQVVSAGGTLEVGPLYRSCENVGGVLKDAWGCGSASTNIAFLPSGQIAGCSSLGMIARRFPELIIGDIVEGINGDAAARFLAVAQAGLEQRPDCQGCATASNCNGGCLAINLSDRRNPFWAPRFFCRTIAAIPGAWECAWERENACPR
jgi:radical SAM protein with 4Fe4S-binding SPASM domain